MNTLTIQFIKDYFKNVKFSVSSCRSFLIKNEQVKKEAENILLSIPEYQSLHHIIEYALYDMQLPICKNCGKYLTATQHKIILRRNGHNYCKVCNALPEIKKTIRLNALPKFKQTMLEKYGVQFSVLSEQIQQKRRKTCLEKYGSEYAISSSDVREKIKQTCLDKYGVENITKLNKSEFFDKCKIFGIQPLFPKEDFLNDLNKDCKIYKLEKIDPNGCECKIIKSVEEYLKVLDNVGMHTCSRNTLCGLDKYPNISVKKCWISGFENFPSYSSCCIYSPFTSKEEIVRLLEDVENLNDSDIKEYIRTNLSRYITQYMMKVIKDYNINATVTDNSIKDDYVNLIFDFIKLMPIFVA